MRMVILRRSRAAASSSSPALASLRTALERTFEHRGTHPLPESVPLPPASWASVYARIVDNDGLEWRTLDELTRAVQTVLDPVLAAGEIGTWDPNAWGWSSARE